MVFRDVAGWLAKLFGWLADWLGWLGWLASWMAGLRWLAETKCVVSELLIDWLIDWSIDWLIDWLNDGLIDLIDWFDLVWFELVWLIDWDWLIWFDWFGLIDLIFCFAYLFRICIKIRLVVSGSSSWGQWPASGMIERERTQGSVFAHRWASTSGSQGSLSPQIRSTGICISSINCGAK